MSSPSAAPAPAPATPSDISPIVPQYTRFDLEKRVRDQELKVCLNEHMRPPSECACHLAIYDKDQIDQCMKGYEAGHNKFKEQPTRPFGTLEWCVSEANNMRLADPQKKHAWSIGCMNGVRQ